MPVLLDYDQFAEKDHFILRQHNGSLISYSTVFKVIRDILQKYWKNTLF